MRGVVGSAGGWECHCYPVLAAVISKVETVFVELSTSQI